MASPWPLLLRFCHQSRVYIFLLSLLRLSHAPGFSHRNNVRREIQIVTKFYNFHHPSLQDSLVSLAAKYFSVSVDMSNLPDFKTWTEQRTLLRRNDQFFKTKENRTLQNSSCNGRCSKYGTMPSALSCAAARSAGWSLVYVSGEELCVVKVRIITYIIPHSSENYVGILNL
jgi:hypothetical protein